MNLPKHLKVKINQYRERCGVTIVEVLTSIIVAVIGVAGVLVMIPFGIRQAEVGLDLEDSSSLAENAMARFHIEGYGRVSLFQGEEVLPWIDVERQTPIPLDYDPVLPNGNPDPYGYYFIDPLWLSVHTAPGNLYPDLAPDPDIIDALFKYVGNNPQDAVEFQYGILSDDVPPFQPRHVHLLDSAFPFDASVDPPIANPTSLAVAARMFVSRNDLQFSSKTDPVTGLDIDEKSPPRPYIDFDGTGGQLRRQFRGEISWSAIAIPKRKTGDVNLIDDGQAGQRTEGFDFYVMVYKDRSFEDPMNIVNPDSDPRFLYSTLSTNPNTNSDQIFGSGTVVLDGAIDIKNDEWVMLLNYDRNAQAHVAFYRVIGSDPDPVLSSITLDGSDFIIRDFLDNGDANRSPTYIVYLRDVISVFKRQLTFEPDSNLNQF